MADMKIWLNNEWYIGQIPYNYTVVQLELSKGNAKNKTSNPRIVENVTGYYSTFESALKGYTKARAKKDSENFEGTLEEYLLKYKDITNNCVSEMKRINRF